jgi:hypothetical protein
MQAVAAELSGYPDNPATPDYSAAFFGEKKFEAVCFGSFILKLALKWAWSAYLRAF